MKIGVSLLLIYFFNKFISFYKAIIIIIILKKNKKGGGFKIYFIFTRVPCPKVFGNEKYIHIIF